MGICYYLWRDDNKTVYELGKVWDWGSIFSSGRASTYTPMTLKPEDAPELAELLRAHLIEKDRKVRLEFGEAHGRTVTPLDYFAFVCADIARWSEGQPFEFISENDHRYENASMEGYPNYTNRQFRTGSRFDAWLERGPRCECAEPKIDDWPGSPMCTTCGRYKMCPVCGEHVAPGQVACSKHVHRVQRKS
jgi:hypothetical protein